MEAVLLWLLGTAITIYVLWVIIRSAVLSALRAHSDEEARIRERERLEQEVRDRDREYKQTKGI